MDTLAARANLTTKDAGFIKCSVESYTHRWLAFEFDNVSDAQSFLERKLMLGMQAISTGEPETLVLIKQP